MAENVSLMVVPTNDADALPQILMDQNGVWQDMSPPLTARSAERVTRIKDKIDRHLGELMQQVAQGAKFTADTMALKAPFLENYKLLIPSHVQEILASAAQSGNNVDDIPILRIHVHPYSEWIPWELLHDGKDFLGLRFQIARLPIVSNVPNISGSQLHRVQHVYNLLGKNVIDVQDIVEQTAWEETFKGLADPPIQEHRMPNGVGNYPNVDSITEARDADILHVTCHGGLRDDQGQVYWTLDHRSNARFLYHLTSSMIEAMTIETKPLVFGNACASTAGAGAPPAGGPAAPQPQAGGLIPGFGSYFFARGALNFIGTFAPITRQLAINFAREFYKRLLGEGGQPGLAIARALWSTKQFYRAHPQPQEREDPSYLFYCLYGPPDTTFTKQ